MMYRTITEEECLENIRKDLIEKRKACDISKPEFADFLGVTKKAVYDFEKGRFTSYEMICKYLYTLYDEAGMIKIMNRIKTCFLEDISTRMKNN